MVWSPPLSDALRLLRTTIYPVFTQQANSSPWTPEESESGDNNEYASDDSLEPDRSTSYIYTCEEIRQKIHQLVESAEQIDEDLRDRFEDSVESYDTFLWYQETGVNRSTYRAAHRYFVDRDKREKRKVEAAAPKRARYNVSGVYIRGECYGEVPVYDSCDVVRRKMISTNKNRRPHFAR